MAEISKHKFSDKCIEGVRHHDAEMIFIEINPDVLIYLNEQDIIALAEAFNLKVSKK